MSAAEHPQWRDDAEDRCDHTEEWVSRAEGDYTADSCWSCMLDAYFDHRTSVEVVDEGGHDDG